jgi:hypothetical protein
MKITASFYAITSAIVMLLALPAFERCASAAPADPNQGPGGPILVITSPTSTFGKYYAEILRTEGLNAFAVADIGTVTAATLNAYDVAVLAPATLTAVQVTMFTNWVNAGGNLLACDAARFPTQHPPRANSSRIGAIQCLPCHRYIYGRG